MKRTKRTLRKAMDLIETGLAAPGSRAELERITGRYAVAITPAIADLVHQEGGKGPVASQFVPDPLELGLANGEDADPLGEDTRTPVEGVVHRYPDRVLLKLTSIC